MTAFGVLAETILAPLAGRSDADWFRAPPGKWSPGEIVHHLTVAIDNSGMGFASREGKPPMRRRPLTPYQRVARLLIFGLGWFPPGRKSPAAALPAARPERAATETQLREAVARFVGLAGRLLPARSHDLFVKHPVMGDLTLPEWERFHVLHAAHHLKQIRARLP